MTTEPGNYDFIIYQGADFNPVIVWKDQNGTLINLTGYTAAMMVRSSVNNPIPFITLNTSNGGITLGGSAGTITLTISAANTALLTIINGVYDLELTDGSGLVTRLLQGTVTLSQEVTK